MIMAVTAAPTRRRPIPLTLSTIGKVAFSDDPEKQIRFFQQKNLLATSKVCSCGTAMSMGRKGDITDKHIFRCPSCKTTKSIRSESFFSKSKMTLSQWLILLYWWVKEYPILKAAEEADVSDVSAIDVYQWLREVCSTALIQQPIILGGPGKVVQIDKSMFKHKPKVCKIKKIYYAMNIFFSASQRTSYKS